MEKRFVLVTYKEFNDPKKLQQEIKLQKYSLAKKIVYSKGVLKNGHK